MQKLTVSMTQEAILPSDLSISMQLRSLAGMGWQQDPAHFQAYARAIMASAQLLLDSNLPTINKRELASGRMLLQSFLKSVG